MPTLEVAVFALGAILLLTGILGGGFEIREFKVPPIGRILRMTAATLGLLFTTLGIALKASNSPPPDQNPAHAAAPAQVAQPVPNPAAPSGPQAPADDVKASLAMATQAASAAQIEASQTLDPAPLHNYYEGEALRLSLAQIEELRRRGAILLLKLEGQNFEGFQVSPDGQRAQVRVTETWSGEAYEQQSHACISKTPPYRSTQTMHLKRGGGERWMVESYVQEQLETPNPQPC